MSLPASADPQSASQPLFIAIGGMIGTGKTTLAEALLPHLPGAFLIDADIERKKLNGVALTDKLPAEAYSRENTMLYIEHMHEVQRQALRQHSIVISTATWLSPRARDNIEDAICAEANAAFVGVWLEAPYTVLFNRVSAREKTLSVSDAGVDVLKRLAGHPVTPPDNTGAWHTLNAEKSVAALTDKALAVIRDAQTPASPAVAANITRYGASS